ncbi:MAG TPA: hypothetical protein VI322_05440 [Candidatus Saccharimonadia bacterium]
MRRRTPAEAGYVSLLTAILISLLLLTITMSMVVLEVAQLRKASDSEQSLKAYYTAEAGVEDAVNRVLSGAVTSDQNCSNAAGNPLGGASQNTFDSAGAAGWTCQQISFSGAPQGKLDQPDVAKTVDPGASLFSSVVLEWDQSAGTLADNAPLGLLPTQAAYNSAPFMPPVEMTVIRYPTGQVRTNDICTGSQTPSNSSCLVLLQNALFVPGGPAAGGTVAFNDGFSSGGPYQGNCQNGRTSNPYYSATPYRCYIRLTGFAGSGNYMFRLRSKYGASSYRMTFYNPAGNVVAVPDGTATVDVTARAGDTFRRTITKVPITNNQASGLNYVVFSDSGVCKTFEVVDNVFPTTGAVPTCN